MAAYDVIHPRGDTFISRDLVAYEMGWFAEDRSGLRLLQAFEAWAQSRGAAMIAMSCNGGAARLSSRE